MKIATQQERTENGELANANCRQLCRIADKHGKMEYGCEELPKCLLGGCEKTSREE